MPGAPLPTRLLRALRDRSSHPPADRLPHTRNLEQIERLLDRAPVVLGDENSMAALAGDVDRLVGLRGLIEKAVQLFPRLARRHGAHKKLSPTLAYAIAYASAMFGSQAWSRPPTAAGSRLREIARKELRSSPNRDGFEMAEVESGDRFRTESLRDRHDHRVHQSEREGFVTPTNPMCLCKVGFVSPLDRQSTCGQIGEKGFLRAAADMGSEKVVNFRKNRPGENPGLGFRFEQLPKRRVMPIVCVDESDHRSRVRDDHSRGRLARSCSARSEMSPRPLRPA